MTKKEWPTLWLPRAYSTPSAPPSGISTSAVTIQFRPPRGGDDPVPPAERRRRIGRDVGGRGVVDVVIPGVHGPRARGVAEELDHAVVEREHAVLARLHPPGVDELAQLRGMLLGEIVALGEVLVEVVQRPLVVGVGVPGLVVGGDLPAVRPQAAVANLLEVLGRPGRRR